jgi:hypothetical protein
MARHVVQNSADPQQIAEAADWQEDLARDLDYILQSPRGRRFLYSLIFDTCCLERACHVPGDPESTARNDGVRMVGQNILSAVRSRDYAKYLKMLEECQEEAE